MIKTPESTLAQPPDCPRNRGHFWGDMPRKRIREGERVPVRFTINERALLLDHTSADPEYAERLRPVPGKGGLAGAFTLDDFEDMLGYIAAEANHAEYAKLQRALHALFARLSDVQASYDDKNWADSGNLIH